MSNVQYLRRGFYVKANKIVNRALFFCHEIVWEPIYTQISLLGDRITGTYFNFQVRLICRLI